MAEDDRISVIEDIMIEGIKAVLPEARVEPRTIPLTEDELKKVLTLAPFVMIEYNGGNAIARSESGLTTATRLAFNVFVGAKSLRSKEEGRRSSYGMLSSVREALDGVTLSDTDDATRHAGPFAWQSEAIFFDTAGGTIYQAIYSLDE